MGCLIFDLKISAHVVPTKRFNNVGDKITILGKIPGDSWTFYIGESRMVLVFALPEKCHKIRHNNFFFINAFPLHRS